VGVTVGLIDGFAVGLPDGLVVGTEEHIGVVPKFLFDTLDRQAA